MEDELNNSKRENEQQKSRIIMLEHENSKLQSNHSMVLKSEFFFENYIKYEIQINN